MKAELHAVYKLRTRLLKQWAVFIFKFKCIHVMPLHYVTSDVHTYKLITVIVGALWR